MNLHNSAVWTFDMVAVPVAGTMFLALTAWACVRGELTFNGQLVNHTADPAKFLLLVGAGTLIGLACWMYAAIRYWNR